MEDARILLVEDERKIADSLKKGLTENQYEVEVAYDGLVGKKLFNSYPFDLAILDINLHREMVFPLARALRARNIPFVFTTGYDRTSVEAEFQDVHLWEKPLDITAMASDLAGLIQRR